MEKSCWVISSTSFQHFDQFVLSVSSNRVSAISLGKLSYRLIALGKQSDRGMEDKQLIKLIKLN